MIFIFLIFQSCQSLPIKTLLPSQAMKKSKFEKNNPIVKKIYYIFIEVKQYSNK